MIATGGRSRWNSGSVGAGALTASGTLSTETSVGTFGPVFGSTIFAGAGGLTSVRTFDSAACFSITRPALGNTIFAGAGALISDSILIAETNGGTFSAGSSGMSQAVVSVAGGVILAPMWQERNATNSPGSNTSNTNVVNISEYRRFNRLMPSSADTSDENIPGLLKDNLESRFETNQLIADFQQDIQTEESMESYELSISDIIDRHGKIGIAALEAQLFRPSVEPLTWKFLGALGVRRGLPLDNIAKGILLRHLNSTSAGRRSAAASALGAFPDGMVLAALERRAAIETNRIVRATLKAHIRVLRRDGLPTAKIA